ncbi:MAG: hypothetical protein AAB325_15005 [Pseudomonadota bacterium]
MPQRLPLLLVWLFLKKHILLNFLDVLNNRKDAEMAYMLYHLMLITGLRLSEALSLNAEHTCRAKVELKVRCSNDVEVLCGCLPAGRQVFPEDLEEAAEMLAER